MESSMFVQAVEAILADACTPAVVRRVEAGGSALELSARIESAGFHELLVSEAEGGAGAGWADVHQVIALCGACAVPLPLGQTLVARRLLERPARLPPGPITFAPAASRSDTGSVQAPFVPFGRVASHVIASLDHALVLLPVAEARVIDRGVPGSLAASLEWPGGGERLAADVPPGLPLTLGALIHAALIGGAMKRVLAMTLAFANTRVQFGKSIGKFQAIQQQLSLMAEEVVAASMGARAAFGDAAEGVPGPVACAAAKARASEAAQSVASIAHAVHGAIGVTREYDLQLFTRRLHEWRMAHGSEAYWYPRVGQAYIASGEARIAEFGRGVFA